MSATTKTEYAKIKGEIGELQDAYVRSFKKVADANS
jgi:hypothetical protein